MSRILVIHTSLGYGGAEKMLVYVANVFAEVHEVKLLLLQNNNITLDVDPSITIETYDLYPEKPIIGRRLIEGLLAFGKMEKIIKKEVKKFNADVVFCFDLRLLVAAYIAVRDIDVYFIFSERADPYYNTKRWSYILNYIFKRIDYVVFQTDGAKEYYSERIQQKACVIPNPAISRTSCCNNEIVEYGYPYIFSAGQMIERKGFDILINAFSKVVKIHKDYKLVLYGNGNQEENLKRLARELQIEDLVLFFPATNNVIEKNINAQLFVLSSTSEGIPNIMIEAMMNDIPVVAADCSPGGARLLSENGKYCYLVENKNADKLAEAISYALEHVDEAREKAEQAQESLRRFDSRKIAERWLKVMDDVIKMR